MIAAPLLLAANMHAATLNEIRQAHKLPALSRAKLQDGRLAVEDSGSTKNHGHWHLGSDTKAMTATLLARFVERGKLKWDSKLGELFPSMDMDPAFTGVTVEMLTSQRSGIPNTMDGYPGLWGKLWDLGDEVSQGRELVARTILAAPPASTPGSRFEYSNSNYIIAGLILERISGLSWERLVERDLFRPLGMRCGFGSVWGHETKDGKLVPIFKDNPPSLGPAGTVHCSLADWAKFAQLHLDGAAGRPTKLLKTASFAKLHAAPPGQDYTYGGWIKVQRGWAGPTGFALTHAGSNTMNYAVLWLAPEKNLALMAATNAAGPQAEQATDEAVAGLIAP